MKLRHLLYAFAAALPLLVSCQEEKPLDPVIRVNPAVLTLTDPGATVQTIQFTAGRAWSVISKPDWVDAVNPDHGDPSDNPQQVTIAIKSNAGNDREGNIVFAIGRPAEGGRDFAPLARAAVKVSQPGEGGALTPGTGTKEDPYSVAGVLEYLKTLGNNVNSPTVYIKGVVSKVTETYTASGTNGNATFYIKDTPEDADDFYCYRLMYLGNKKFTAGKEDVKVGDNVVICGKVVNYSGSAGKVTPETVQKEAYLYSLNGNSEEGQEQTEITDATVAQFIQSDGNTYYRLTGKVSSFTTGHNNTGNYDYMQFNLTDATGTVIVYGFKDRDASYQQWATKIKDGGTVVLTGTYEKYTDKNGNVKDEVMNTTIESFTEGQAQTDFEEITVAQFIQKADEATAYRLTGTVSGWYTRTSNGKNYMGFDLTDATGTVTVYGFKDGQYDQWSTKIKDGGTVKLHGTYGKYNNSDGSVKHEVMNTEIEEFTEGQEQTEFERITVAQFIQNADKVKGYELAGKVSDFETHDSNGKTYMTFNLTDASGTIYVYSFADGQVDQWKNQISDGGDIVLRGTYSYYANEQKHEVVKATIVSFQADANYKYCRVDGSKEINVKADVTSVNIKILANADWTLTARGDVTLSNATGSAGSEVSGSADATVTASFPANESTDAEKVYTLILACSAASVNETITITQAKAGAAGEGTLVYTLNGNETGGSNGYATDSDITQGDIAWKAMGNTTMAPWRFGGKNLTNENRAIYSTTAISNNISRVEVTSGTATATVNSLTISVHNSAADAGSGSNAIATKTVTSGITSATVVLSKEDATSWANKFYRIVYNVSAGSSNQYVQFVKAEFYGE